MPVLTKSVLDRLQDKIKESELPILRQSAARVITLASSSKTEINALAQIILQDQAFTARVLRMANTFFYNRQSGRPVTSVTRAILLIGYGALRDLALAGEFAEFAQKHLPAGVDLRQIIAKAFVAANQASDLGKALELPNTELLFTSALLQSIGELALAYHLPTVRQNIQTLMIEENLSYSTAHQRVVGASPKETMRKVCEPYQIPQELVAATLPCWEASAQWTDEDRWGAVIHLANDVARNLLSPASPASNASLDHLLRNAAAAFHVETTKLTSTVTSAFEQTLQLADVVKFDPKHLVPSKVTSEGAPTVRAELVEACIKIVAPALTSSASQAASQTSAPVAAPSSESTGPPSANTDEAASTPAYLNYLTDLGAHMLEKPDFNTILNLALEGLHRGAGFTHTFLLLSSPKDRQFIARLGFGPLSDTFLNEFAIPQEGPAACPGLTQTSTSMRFESLWPGLAETLPPQLLQSLRPVGIALGPLRTNNRLIGLIWADLPAPIPDSLWTAFELLTLQANVGLRSLAR